MAVIDAIQDRLGQIHEPPQQLERQRSVDRHADLVVVAAPELDGEDHDQHGDEHGEKRRDRHHEEVNAVDLRGLRGRLLRKEWKIREHR